MHGQLRMLRVLVAFARVDSQSVNAICLLQLLEAQRRIRRQEMYVDAAELQRRVLRMQDKTVVDQRQRRWCSLSHGA